MLPRATAQYEAFHADLLEETATALAQHRQLEVMEDLLPVDNLRAIGEFNDPRPAPKKLPTPKQLRAVVVGVWDVVAEQLFGDAIRECARQGGTVAQFRGGDFLPRVEDLLPRGAVNGSRGDVSPVVRADNCPYIAMDIAKALARAGYSVEWESINEMVVGWGDPRGGAGGNPGKVDPMTGRAWEGRMFRGVEVEERERRYANLLGIDVGDEDRDGGEQGGDDVA